MSHFNYRNGELYAEGVSVANIAEQYGSPTYIYSRATLEQNFLAYEQALEGCPHLVCYSVKSNSNIGVLNLLARLGAGFDIVSLGELERVLAAGGSADKIVFSGVGKSRSAMVRALEVGIHCFNVESPSELEVLNDAAGSLNLIAPVSLRVNPDFDANTHPYISTGLRENKFGIEIDQAAEVYRTAHCLKHIVVKGIDCHIGSQLTETSPLIDALRRLLEMVDLLAAEGIAIEHLDLGGGLGVCYKDEQPPAIADYISEVRNELGERALTLMFEPGRSISANAGILLTQVEYLKLGSLKNFAIVDAAMNDMIRPALYQAWLNVLPVSELTQTESQHYDVVGPVCETGDFLAKDRELAISPGDYLAVMGAGAYGFVMSSNYNTRGRAAEIIIDGNTMHQVRPREDTKRLFDNESILPL